MPTSVLVHRAEGQGMEGGINVSFSFEAGVMCVGQETPGLNPWFPSVSP